MRAILFIIYSLVTLFVLVSCAPFQYGAAGLRETTLAQRGYTSHPLYSYQGDSRYWSEVKMSGSEVKLLLDSGANSTDITQQTAQQIGIQINSKFSVVSRGALGREVRSKTGYTRLDYGAQSIAPFMVVVNEPRAQKTSTGAYDGQIGLNALVEMGALIEVAQKRIWMPTADIPNHQQYPLLGMLPQLGRHAMPLYSSGKYSHLVLRNQYKGQVMHWIVDTGAEISLIDRQSAQRAGLVEVKTNSKMVDISGDTSALGFTIMDQMQLNQTTLQTVPLAVANLSMVKKTFKAKDGITIDGIIGVDILMLTEALIDPRSKVIYLGLAEQRGQTGL